MNITKDQVLALLRHPHVRTFNGAYRVSVGEDKNDKPVITYGLPGVPTSDDYGLMTSEDIDQATNWQVHRKADGRSYISFATDGESKVLCELLFAPVSDEALRQHVAAYTFAAEAECARLSSEWRKKQEGVAE